MSESASGKEDDMPQSLQRDWYGAAMRQAVIGRQLRRMYGDVVHEPIPDDFIDLLRRVDESEEKKEGSSQRRSPEGIP
jgi:hypothetical protein